MSFFDNLKETAKNLGDKAADTAEIAKIKMKISSAENDIKSVYTAMGKKLFEEHPEYLEKFFTEEKGKIDELKATIAGLNDKIEAVKNTVGKVTDEVKDEVKEEVEEVKDKIEEAL
jgi:chromosome segregation ATPase